MTRRCQRHLKGLTHNFGITCWSLCFTITWIFDLSGIQSPSMRSTQVFQSSLQIWKSKTLSLRMISGYKDRVAASRTPRLPPDDIFVGRLLLLQDPRGLSLNASYRIYRSTIESFVQQSRAYRLTGPDNQYCNVEDEILVPVMFQIWIRYIQVTSNMFTLTTSLLYNVWS
jgi:hypothetical protein